MGGCEARSGPCSLPPAPASGCSWGRCRARQCGVCCEGFVTSAKSEGSRGADVRRKAAGPVASHQRGAAHGRAGLCLLRAQPCGAGTGQITARESGREGLGWLCSHGEGEASRESFSSLELGESALPLRAGLAAQRPPPNNALVSPNDGREPPPPDPAAGREQGHPSTITRQKGGKITL